MVHVNVHAAFTSKCWLVSEENEGAELMCRHIAEGTSDKTVLLQCQFVSVGLVLVDRVKGTEFANGEQIRR
jgi:hypothetical protein